MNWLKRSSFILGQLYAEIIDICNQPRCIIRIFQSFRLTYIQTYRLYCTSKQFWPILFSKLLYKMVQDFLAIQQKHLRKVYWATRYVCTDFIITMFHVSINLYNDIGVYCLRISLLPDLFLNYFKLWSSKA